MGLFGKSKAEKKERKELKGQVEKLMKDYDKKDIDGATYIQKMLEVTSSHQKKK